VARPRAAQGRRGVVDAPAGDEALAERRTEARRHRMCATEAGVLEEDDLEEASNIEAARFSFAPRL